MIEQSGKWMMIKINQFFFASLLEMKIRKKGILFASLLNLILIADKIIIASLNGILRIFTCSSSNDTSLKSYQANDLLIESDLKHPILQISIGLFLSTSKSSQLAILHPRKLSVYSISSKLI